MSVMVCFRKCFKISFLWDVYELKLRIVLVISQYSGTLCSLSTTNFKATEMINWILESVPPVEILLVCHWNQKSSLKTYTNSTTVGFNVVEVRWRALHMIHCATPAVRRYMRKKGKTCNEIRFHLFREVHVIQACFILQE